MKHWLATAAAAAAAPLLVACASAGAATEYTQEHDRHHNVLVVNGERIVIRDGAHAIHIIEEALEDGEDASLTFDFDFDFDSHSWSEEDLAEFEAEMEELGDTLRDLFAEDSEFQVAVNQLKLDEDALNARIEVLVEQSERQAERAMRHAERAVERAERDAERQARRAERQARRAVERAREHEHRAVSISIDTDSIARAGMIAAEAGLEAGLSAIDRTLERGWKTEDGERVPLTREDRAELREARAELEEGLEELRLERADWHEEHRSEAPRHTHHYEDRQVRIIERDGETRVWVNGRELTGAEKETWLEAWRSSEQAQELEGGPGAPPPPPLPPRR